MFGPPFFRRRANGVVLPLREAIAELARTRRNRPAVTSCTYNRFSAVYGTEVFGPPAGTGLGPPGLEMVGGLDGGVWTTPTESRKGGAARRAPYGVRAPLRSSQDRSHFSRSLTFPGRIQEPSSSTETCQSEKHADERRGRLQGKTAVPCWQGVGVSCGLSGERAERLWLASGSGKQPDGYHRPGSTPISDPGSI